ncbi:pyridoxal phosphate-dependent transferase [Dipodascopsis uninucleata]
MVSPPPPQIATEVLVELSHRDNKQAGYPIATMMKGEKPSAINLLYHLSEESKVRQKSLLKVSSSMVKGDPLSISLAAGLPAPSLFPLEQICVSFKVGKREGDRASEWKEDGLYDETISVKKTKHSTRLNESAYDLSTALQYEQGTGSKELLKYITEHTRTIHDPPYKNWQCILTGGNTHAMETTFRMLLNPGDYILMEEFAFPETVESLRPLRVNMIGIKMDQEGMRSDELSRILSTWNEKERGSKRPTTLYVVPSGQNPTGATMSIKRRQEIYDLCKKYDLVIIEDDPYYFLQMREYISDPSIPIHSPKTNKEFLDGLLPSLTKLDVDGRVLRLDSLSKVFAPGIRCGWITGSEYFVERVLRHNEVGLQFPSGLSMAVLYSALVDCWGQDGYLDWLVNLSCDYTSRRNAILRAMEKHLPREVCSWIVPAAGMFVWIRIDHSKYPVSDHDIFSVENALFNASVDEHVIILPGSWFKVNEEYNELFFRATYACETAENMTTAIERFGIAVRRCFQLN